MKRIILQLMSELSNLTSPFNPVDINKIFAKYPSLDATQVQPELQNHLEQLLALNTLTKQCFDLANQKHCLSSQQEHLTALSEELYITQENIDTLLGQMQLCMKSVNTSFHNLMPQINENLLKVDKITPPYSATVDNKTQKIAVEEYSLQLSTRLGEIDTRAARLKFLQLKKAIHDLLDELRTDGINLSTRDDKNSLKKLIASVALSLSQLKEIKPKMTELHQLFSRQISGIDIQAKVQELKRQTAHVEKLLEPIELELSINTLDPKIKERLSEEFQLSSKKSDLIKAYQNKLPSALTYIDPYAWKSWVQDQHQYEIAQLKAENSVSYLLLLEQEHKLTLDKIRLVNEIKILGSLLSTAQSFPGSDSGIPLLIKQANMLFSECILLLPPLGVSSIASPADYYLAIFSYIPVIEQKLEQMAVILNRLQTVDNLQIEIIQLETQHKFESNINSLPVTQKDFERLTQHIESEKPEKELLMQQYELCKSFLVKARNLEEIKRQLQASIVRKKDIEKTLSVANLGDPIQDQMSIISGQLADLRVLIAAGIKQISLLPLPIEQSKEQQDSALEVVQEAKSATLAHEQLEQAAQESLNLDQLSMLTPECQTGPILSPDQTVSLSKHPIPNEVMDCSSSTSTFSFPDYNEPDTRFDSPESLDTSFIVEQPFRESLPDPEDTSNRVLLAPVKPRSMQPDEQLVYFVATSLNSDPALRPTEEKRGDPLTAPEMIVLASKPPLLSEESQNAITSPAVPLSLKSDQIVIINESPYELTSSDNIASTSTETLLAATPELDKQSTSPFLSKLKQIKLPITAQEKPVEQLASSGEIVLIIKKASLTQPVSNQQSASSVPTDLNPDQPLTPIQDNTVRQLLSLDKIVITPNSLSTKAAGDEQSFPIIPTELLPDEALPCAHEKLETDLLSSNKIVLNLQQALTVKNIPEEQSISISLPDLKVRQLATEASEELLISSSPRTQKFFVKSLYNADGFILAPSSLNHPELQKWQDCYQQSLNYLKYHSIDIQQWYMDLYKAIEAYSNDEDTYKKSHLIRDILFELQYKKDLGVIKAYMRLCPHPEKDLHLLLSLKPNLPLVDESFGDVSELQDKPAELTSLYAQYTKLKKDHPVEGKLLLQAIHSLQMAKIFIDTHDSNISVTQIPHLSKDPRYEPLKRHRGFFKLWEAIEDFFRMLIGKITGQVEFEYTNRPCFFRTKSAQLVEEADLIIQNDLLPQSAT
ncbi:interaptin [Legionella antarctica]|uniref:Interaptin n=1 Tax=Legionella antarctica TaxID=2708020 RepID=A0A6F8T8D3_9GAMM|nr:hypothetical protein [Legionella antarctica]BCA96935.1 interaptin [Legionella antarctica]